MSRTVCPFPSQSLNATMNRANVCVMSSARHRTFVFLLALALAASGIGRAMSVEHPCAPAAEHAVMHSGAHADHHLHHSDDDKNSTKSGAKCCGMCIVAATGILPAPHDMTASTVSSVYYPVGSHSLYGRWVLLDPGIPKTLS